MSFAPDALIEVARFLVSKGTVNLGVVGDDAHKAKGFSYHLGADDLKPNASSASLPRDKAGLSNAASAIDIGKVGGNLRGLRRLSTWLVRECLAGAPDTLDIREIIYSEDGKIVSRWEGRNGPPGKVLTGPTQGDNTHLTHTHISYFRDSESRVKVGLFRRFYEEGDVRITQVKGEEWLPRKNSGGDSDGVLRTLPDRSTIPVDKVPLNTIVRSIAEVTAAGERWRLTKFNGKTLFMLRSDFEPVVPGGDPAIDAKLTAYIDRTAG